MEESTANEMCSISSTEVVDCVSLPSQIHALTNIIHEYDKLSQSSPPDSEKLLQDSVTGLETKVKQLASDISDIEALPYEDAAESCLEYLREELRATEAENAKISDEIEGLRKAYVEGTCKLESDIEELNHVLVSVESKGVHAECPKLGEHPAVFSKAYSQRDFEIWDLSNQVESNEKTLKKLEDLDSALKRFDAIDKISATFTGLEVLSFEGNCIRLALKTYITNVECLMYQGKLGDTDEPSELKHELLIEVVDDTMEIKNAEIFPSDIYLGEIVEAVTSFREVSSALSVLESRSSLAWFLQKVRDRIVMCTLRRLMLRTASKSRHSLEYSDRDELIIASMVGGVDAFIKPSQGWPIFASPLKLVYLKASDHNAKEISLSLLCIVEEAANSLDSSTRRSVTNFVNAIQEILVQKMRLELRSDHNPN